MDRQAAEREKDQAVAAERDRQEAVALLTHAEEVLASGDLWAADVALTQAEGRVGADGPADLRDRLAGAKRDRDLVRDLRAIEDLSWVPGNVSMPDHAAMAGRYRAAFASYGLDVGGVDPGVAADAVRASRVSAALVAGLGEWFATAPDQLNLRRLLDRLDPDPGRVAIRAALAAGDEGRVKGLVKALDGSTAPAWFAVSVGYHRLVPFEDGVRLMKAAWRAHQADYVLAFRIAERLWGRGEDRLPEMLAWARLAVALRPDSPFPHTLYATACRGMHNWSEAEASSRRAIELSRKYPRYAGAHVSLGTTLLDKGDLDGAEASYRDAMATDPDATGIYYNMGLLNDRRGDLGAAETWYRKAVIANPTHAYFREILDGLVRRRAKLPRLEDIAAGRADPVNIDEAFEAIGLVSDSSRRQYTRAVKLFSWVLAANPTLADDPSNYHRYNAACCAVLAAAGKDKDLPNVETAERSRLTGLAMKWLRADLAQMTTQAKDPKRHRQVGKWLTHWKKDEDLASVRDPERLAAMPPTDRKSWETLWRDVDALLNSITRQPR
jgi:tetratricopeptide (TPR) repeat protein